ncbi:MAG: hypothetical protein AB1611_14430 [bacterium]
MIDVKTAANKAYEYFRDLYADKDFSAVLLEEVELTDDQNFWLITLSYLMPAMDPPQLFGTAPKRAYKIFTIDANTGKVKSMKIRTIK